MNNMILIMIAGLEILLALAISFYIAYKRVVATNMHPVCQKKNIAESDISLDKIAEKYIKLTNLD